MSPQNNDNDEDLNHDFLKKIQESLESLDTKDKDYLEQLTKLGKQKPESGETEIGREEIAMQKLDAIDQFNEDNEDIILEQDYSSVYSDPAYLTQVPKLKIKTLQLENFRGLSTRKFQFDNVNYFVGSPNAGKTIILNAINLLFLNTSRIPDDRVYKILESNENVFAPQENKKFKLSSLVEKEGEDYDRLITNKSFSTPSLTTEYEYNCFYIDVKKIVTKDTTLNKGTLSEDIIKTLNDYFQFNVSVNTNIKYFGETDTHLIYLLTTLYKERSLIILLDDVFKLFPEKYHAPLTRVLHEYAITKNKQLFITKKRNSCFIPANLGTTFNL